MGHTHYKLVRFVRALSPFNQLGQPSFLSQGLPFPFVLQLFIYGQLLVSLHHEVLLHQILNDLLHYWCVAAELESLGSHLVLGLRFDVIADTLVRLSCSFRRCHA